MKLNVCLVVVAVVAMATAAPIANEEKLINGAEGDDAVRAKRADEMLYYGNQQNNPRGSVMKKSEGNILLELPKPEYPKGEEDEGGVIVAHEETPISPEMEERMKSLEPSEEQAAKMDEAVDEALESAMHAAASPSNQDGLASSEDVSDVSDSNTVVADDVQSPAAAVPVVESQGAETVVESGEDGGAEAEDVAGEEVAVAGNEGSESGSDDIEKELLEASAATESQDHQSQAEVESSEASTTEGDADGSAQASEQDESQVPNDEIDEFLNQLRTENGGEEIPTDVNPNLNNYYKNMYEYMVSSFHPQKELDPSRYPYDLIAYRKRRSSGFRSNQPLNYRNKRRTRRIKRDLLDDLASIPPSELTDGYQLSNPDDYVPLSEEEVDYLYSKLLPYLAEAYAEDIKEEPYLEEEEPSPLDSYKSPYSILDEFAPEVEEVYEPEPELPVYGVRPYEEFEPRMPVAIDNEFPSYEKRGMLEYYPAAPTKRYFFPVNDEPDTHWGAFVPQKRDYDSAIHRLQRLALALGDEPGPYYADLLREYKKK